MVHGDRKFWGEVDTSNSDVQVTDIEENTTQKFKHTKNHTIHYT